MLPLSVAWHWTVTDAVHPPLFPALERLAVWALPNAELTLRAIPIAAGCGSVVAAWLLAVRLGIRHSLALVIALFVACSVPLIELSDFARSYALFGFVSVMLVASAVRWWEGDRVRFPTACMALAAALALTHAFAVPVLAAALVAFPLAWPRRRPDVRRWFVAFLPSMALGAAWYVPAMLRIRARGGINVNLGWSKSPSFREIPWEMLRYVGLPDVRHATSVICLLLALFLVLALTARGGFAWTRRYLAVAAVLVSPLVFQLATISPVVNLPFWGVRLIVTSIIGLPIVLGMLAERAATAAPWRGWASVGALAGLVGFNLLTQYMALPDPMREVANRLAQADTRNVAVATSDLWNAASPLSWYANHDCVDSRLLDAQINGTTQQPATPTCAVASVVGNPTGDLLVVYYTSTPDAEGVLPAARERYGSPGTVIFQSTLKDIAIMRFSHAPTVTTP